MVTQFKYHLSTLWSLIKECFTLMAT